MIELNGKYTNAKIFADTIESGVIQQTLNICNHPIFEDCKVRIMPDCHEGKGCVIGFTAPLPKNGEIIPNIIGVDQSCGVLSIKIDAESIDFEKLDKFIRENIPFGMNGRKTLAKGIPDKLKSEIERYNKDYLKRDATSDLLKLGSLGGGNHFISIEKGYSGTYLIVHSGSRNFGNAMAQYFQKKAIETNLYTIKELSYLSDEDAKDYLDCAQTCYSYGQFSRWRMLRDILNYMNWDMLDTIEVVHNYIGTDGIIRKGAISCRKDKKVLIPLNMKDGTIIGVGLENEDWNYSGPHGAGRILSRSKAKDLLNLEDYEKSMEGIWTSCVNQGTLDEAPMVYKDWQEISNLISPTISIVDHLLPIYNFKG